MPHESHLKDLVIQSFTIKPEVKSVYLRILDDLEPGQKEELQRILEEEAKEVQVINKDRKKAESELRRKYVADLKALFTSEQKKAIAREEELEKAGAEGLLDQLNLI